MFTNGYKPSFKQRFEIACNEALRKNPQAENLKFKESDKIPKNSNYIPYNLEFIKRLNQQELNLIISLVFSLQLLSEYILVKNQINFLLGNYDIPGDNNGIQKFKKLKKLKKHEGNAAEEIYSKLEEDHEYKDFLNNF